MTTGGTELLVVLAIAVMLFGPKKLPELARTMGKAMGEYQKAQREFEMEVKKTTSAIDKEVSTVTTVQPGARPAASTQRPSRPVTHAPTTAKPANIKPPTKVPTSEVKEIAKNLGIDTSNKTEDQLLKEISLKTRKKETTK